MNRSHIEVAESSTLAVDRQPMRPSGPIRLPPVGHAIADVAIHPAPPGIPQAKLKMGRRDDPLEREADQVADAVMATPAPGADAALQRQPEDGEDDEVLQRQEDDDEVLQAQPEDDEEAMAAPAPGAAPGMTATTAGAVSQLRAMSGSPLPAGERSFFEGRIGHDFSRVRIHAGDDAGRVARGARARAFTVGRDIVFGSGRYAPGTGTGRRLLAHELTHVVQQGKAPALDKDR